jgi:hypothetical protein
MANGSLSGLAYFDGNGTRAFDDGDVPLEGVGVAIVAAGTRDTVERVVSGGDGAFAFSPVPVGSYSLAVDEGSIGDTVIVARLDPTEVSVSPLDSTIVDVAISFPIVSVAEARALPVGDRIFLDGIALNSWPTFGDSTVHVADTSGTMRCIRVGPGPVFPGDSVRVRGRVSTRSGQRVIDLDRRSPLVLELVESPPPVVVSTRLAATADGSVLDAAFVRIIGARIVDLATVGDDQIVTLDDGSGPVDVVLDGSVTFNPGPFLLEGANLTVSGLLVPTGTGEWQLKPRFDNDMAVIPPVVSVAEARNSAIGEIVFVDGIVLNFLAAYGDSTVHISDNTGAIRGIRMLPVTVFPGDSVRFVGKVAAFDGQPVIDDPTVFPLGFSRLPPPEVVSTFEANAARAGTLDAALVSVANARITDTATVAGDLLATVNDGSGAGVVVFDGAVPFNRIPYVPDAVLNVTGLLVPSGVNTWVVKPRSPADVVVQP